MILCNPIVVNDIVNWMKKDKLTEMMRGIKVTSSGITSMGPELFQHRYCLLKVSLTNMAESASRVFGKGSEEKTE